MPAERGDVGKTIGFMELSFGVKSGVTITKGQAITFDANGFAQIATTTENPNITGRGIALETIANAGADGALAIRACVAGFVYARAGAAIVKFVRLQIDATAGEVATATVGTAAGTEQNKHIDADYCGHEGEIEGTVVTNAADQDTILIRLR